MKKLLAMYVACMMLVAFFASSSFALNAQQAEEYALDTVKEELNSLNADAAADVSLRAEQLDVVEEAEAYFDSNIDSIDWDSLVAAIEASQSSREEELKRFMTIRYFTDKYTGVLTATLEDVVEKLEDIDVQYNLKDIPMGNARSTLNAYTDAVSELYEDSIGSADLETKNLIDSEAANIAAYRKEEIKLSTKVLMKLIFVSTATEFETAYNALRGDDLRLKHIALYLKPFSDADISLSTIKTSAKDYAEENKSALKAEFDEIFTSGYTVEQTAEMSYEFMGKIIRGAYDKYTDDVAQDYPHVYSWLEFFFGENESDTGAIEQLMMEMDTEGKYQNILANIAVRKAIQMTLPGEVFVTESASSTDDDRILVKDGSMASFIIEKPEGIDVDSLGINTDAIAIPTSLFEVVIDCDEPDYEDNVTYDKSTGKFSVTRNSKLSSKYAATITVYRIGLAGGNTVDTYIESYPVWIKNPSGYSPSSSSSSSGNSYITIKLTPNGSVTGPSVVKKGTDAEFEAIADSGYIVGEIFVNGKEITDFVREGVNAKFTVKNITANTTIEVKFIKLLNDKISYAYIKGYPEGDVRPNNNLTREEAATIFYRILTKEAKEKFKTEVNDYTDVNETRWSNKSISTLSNIGILTGFPDGSFGPTQTITRAQFATMVYRFYNVKYSGPDKFTDIAGHWAQSSINAIAVKNWIKGYEDSTFGPNNDITRAEAVTIINRILEREFSAEKFDNKEIFTDCSTTNWFYADIMEASTGEVIE